jgi:hypothetical protein
MRLIKNPPLRVGMDAGSYIFTGLFPAIFLLGFFDCLPLHVIRSIRTATFESNDVIDNPSWTSTASLPGSRAWIHFDKGVALRGISFDALAAIGERRGKCQGKDQGCGLNLQPQCLHTRASFKTNSRQSGHLRCVHGLGLLASSVKAGRVATTKAKGPNKQPRMNHPQPLRSFALAIIMHTMPNNNQMASNSISTPF